MTLEYDTAKQQVYDFWNESSCGENLYLSSDDRDSYLKQAEMRYQLESFILPFANFAATKNQKLLEVGVGLGAETINVLLKLVQSFMALT